MGRGKRNRTPLSDVAGDRRLPEGLAAALAGGEGERLAVSLPPLPGLAVNQVVNADGSVAGAADGYPNQDKTLVTRHGEPFGYAEVVGDECDAYLAEPEDLRADRVGTVRLQGEEAQVIDAEGQLVALGHWRMGQGAVTLVDARGRVLGHASTAELGDPFNDDHEEEQLLATAAAYLLLVR